VALTPRFPRTVCFLLVVLAANLSSVAQTTPQHARVELLARLESVQAGPDVLLGVHFILEPGWHIYWINPGDSGQPASFKWQLPPGFSAGEIQWPRPERLHPSKELVDYGYHDGVLLMIPVHTPQFISTNSGQFGPREEFEVEAKWLVCREVCIPEHAQLRLTLPIETAAKANEQNAALFEKTQKLLPQPMPRTWKATVTSTKDEFLLTIHAGKPIAKAEFFPLDPGQIDNAAPQKLRSSTTGFAMTLKKSDLLVKPITILRGVLVIPNGPAYRIEARVRQPIQ
jgi:DsbC/DsbD-like thiol-disulfide interchange protein